MAALVLRKLLLWMPFLFGIGFIAPLTAQLMVSLGIEAPLGLTPIGFGLIFGGLGGLSANMRGRGL